MPGPTPTPIHLTDRQKAILDQQLRRAKCPRDLFQRATIITLAAEGTSNSDISRLVPANPVTVRTWRGRWQAAEERLLAAEGGDGTTKDQDKVLEATILDVLCDAYRPGAPPHLH
ncbi:MAG TPA: helix-turn-helix domain-containing protein [Candidatus Lokiarchaeia archaeon]|nr:helix-turn-helix domain-containing protein [Candidatus Lokiarchaeia archaeon]